MKPSNASGPWYRHRWPWFITALLGGSVVLSSIMLVLAVHGRDGLVHDRYYDAGKGIDRELSADLLARSLGQQADLQLDSLTGEVRLRLRGRSRPDHLSLNLIAPTQPERDRHVRLARILVAARGVAEYRGQLAEAITGRHMVELLGTGPRGPWRLYEQEWLVPDHTATLGDDAPSGALAP